MSQETPQVIDSNTLSLQHLQRGRKFNPAAKQAATVLYAGLFETGSGGYELWNTSSWSDFTTQWSNFAALGERLVSFDTLEQEATTWYLGAWQELSGAYALWRFTDWDSFYQQFQTSAGTLQLATLDIHPSGGARYFTGAWVAGTTPQTIVHDLDRAQFEARWKALSAGGYRLMNVQAYPSAGADLFTGVFDQGTGSYALLVETDWNAFESYYRAHEATMGLVDFQVYDSGPRRWYIGAWRETAAGSRFVVGLDWGSFANRWQQLSSEGYRLRRVIVYPNRVELPEPERSKGFQAALGTQAEGYAYAVGRRGKVIASDGVHRARSANDPPASTWSPDVRINLASVSKSVTAVALLKLFLDQGRSVDDNFYPFIASTYPTVGAGVATVSVRDLLTMKSGMVVDGTLFMPDVQTFLSTYLQQGLVGTRGQTYAYSNTNFTILQTLIGQLSGQGYVDYVTQSVLIPMGINPSIFNPVPDPSASATLSYSSGTDPLHGMYWPPIQAVAAGGWISSAAELIKFLEGVRSHAVLPAETTLQMLNGQLGWYVYDGLYGQYFHHNGGLLNGLTPAQGLDTGIIHLADGYDALLLVNTWNFDVIGLIVEAFETRT
jgi:CubicO group peptidase (beta-lactamase class C family)